LDGLQATRDRRRGVSVEDFFRGGALALRCLLDRQRLVFARPATVGARGMGGMNGVHENDGLIRRQGIHQPFVERDRRALLVFVETATNDLGFAVFEAKAKQKRDHPERLSYSNDVARRQRRRQNAAIAL
jgi:hypothetical protein